MWVVQDILLALVLVLVLGSLVDGYGYGSTLAFDPCSPSKSGAEMQIAEIEIAGSTLYDQEYSVTNGSKLNNQIQCDERTRKLDKNPNPGYP